MSRFNQKKIVPILTIAFGILLIAIALIFGISLNAPSSTATSIPPQDIQDVPRITLLDAKKAYDTDEAIFLDVRDVNSYMADHIPGAVSIPLNELQARYTELNKKALIITY